MESHLGLRQESTVGSRDEASKKSCQSRLLCFVVTAIAKLATFHRELLPRARVSLGKVSHTFDSKLSQTKLVAVEPFLFHTLLLL